MAKCNDIIRRNGTVFEIVDADPGFIVLANGYQWGTDHREIDHKVGCYTTVYPTREAAKDAIPHMESF
jgi:hypothetical protein